MTTLIPLAWRSLLARRVRTLLTITGIALGIGVLTASLATSTGIESAVDRTVREMVGRADLRVAGFQDRGLSDVTIATIQATPGVVVAAPAVERRLYLAHAAGSASDAAGPVTILGIDPVTYLEVHDLDLVDGRALTAGSAGALISERLAREDGYAIGSELTLQSGSTVERLPVVGILPGNGPLSDAYGRIAVIPIEIAREVFGMSGASRVDIRVAAGASVGDVAGVLATRLSSEPYVLSTPPDLAASLSATTADFQATIAMIAAVALFVAAFLIFNTLSLTVVERSREVGLLRAAGATRGQVLVFVLAGALVLGLVGSLLGIAAGLGLTVALGAGIVFTNAAAFDAAVLTPQAALFVLGVGLFVALAAALEPAWRASRISPVEALKLRIDPTSARQARLRWLVVVFFAVGAVGFLAWPQAAGDAAAARSIVIYAILLAATLLSPLFIAPLARIVGLPFSLVARLDERLARSSLARDRSRTTLTLGALAVSLAMIVAIGGVAQQARGSATAWLSGVVPGDEVASSIRPVALDEPIAKALGAIAGVARVTPVATFDLAYRGIRLDGAAVSGSDMLADGRLTFQQGDRTEALRGLDDAGTVIVASSTANRLGLGLGATMAFTGAEGGTVELRVTGIVERTIPGRTGETVLVGWPDATQRFGVQGADFFAIRFEPGQVVSARPALEAAARSLALEPATLDRVQGAVTDALTRVFGLFDMLALIAVLIAALGIVNTLTMSVVERVREFGILRATGMTGRQVAHMVLVEAGMLGLVGALVGILTGLAAGFVMVELGGGFRVAYEPPWEIMGLAVALGPLVSMAAAYYPARIAARLSIVRAVQFE